VRTLYLLRHAKSSWENPTLLDRERPLAPRGRRDGKLIAEHARRAHVSPELVLCSSAARTRETLDLVRPALTSSSVMFEDELYGASSAGLLARLHLVPDEVESVLLIGHNPGLQQLAVDLASAGDELERLAAKFPTAALATLALEAPWSRVAAGDATLVDYVVPKQLR
jgi:phosphohistidine phosphatase